MFTSLLDEVASKENVMKTTPSSKPGDAAASLSWAPRTRDNVKMAERALKPMPPLGKQKEVEGEALGTLLDKGKGLVGSEISYSEERKRQRQEEDIDEARLLVSNKPVKLECELTEAQKQGDVQQNMAKAIFCTTKVLECLQFLKERAELVEKLEEGSKRLIEVIEKYSKSLEVADYKMNQAIAKLWGAEARAEEAEQRERAGQ